MGKKAVIIIPKTPRKQRRSRTRKTRRKILHIVLSFMIGVVVTTGVHIFITNHRIRSVVEKVCVLFGNDEQKCKDGVDDLLNNVDNVTQNNANISEGDKE